MDVQGRFFESFNKRIADLIVYLTALNKDTIALTNHGKTSEFSVQISIINQVVTETFFYIVKVSQARQISECC